MLIINKLITDTLNINKSAAVTIVTNMPNTKICQENVIYCYSSHK